MSTVGGKPRRHPRTQVPRRTRRRIESDSSRMEQHFLALLGAARDALEKAGLDFGARTIVEQIGKRLGLSNEPADPERYAEEIKRLNETLHSVQSEIAYLRATGTWNKQSAEREGHDPGFGDFVADAFAASADSRDEAKRRLFGRYIARRLQVQTDEQAIAVRRALRTTRDLTQSQLIALAAIVMFYDFGSPDVPFTGRAAAETWLTDRYGAVFQYFMPLPWTDDDLATLASVGALLIGPQDSPTSIFEGGGGAHPLDQWLAQNEVFAGVDMPPDAGSPDWRARQIAAYPTLTKLARLGAGRELDDQKQRDLRLDDIGRLDALQPTPLGAMIGGIVLEQLCTLAPPDSRR